MKLRSLIFAPFLFSLLAFSCNAQNGPTAPTVTLTWAQSTGDTNPISKNCVYRCTGLATCSYQLPALFCSTAPIVTYKDQQVTRGTTYHYAVTAQDTNGAESAFSADLQVTSPTINAPTGLGTSLITKLEKGFPFLFPKKQTVVFNKDRTVKAVAE